MPKVFLSAVALLLAASASGADAGLAITHVEFHESEDGPPSAAGFQFAPGEPIFFSCRVRGYKKAGDEPEKIFLTYQIEARDAAGVLIIPIETGKVAADLAAEDKEWAPKIRHTIVAPPLADPGQYHVTVKVHDEFGKTDAEATAPFSVQARVVAPSETLVVRNFRFLRSEDDKAPLTVAAYRAGDMLWARFDMTGYKLAAKNRFDIAYGLTVLRPNGEPSYSQPEAAADKNESFYPQRYMPGTISLTLPKDLAKGRYTIVLAVRDNIGGQKYETRETFSVE
jgi:hypothetical protein